MKKQLKNTTHRKVCYRQIAEKSGQCCERLNCLREYYNIPGRKSRSSNPYLWLSLQTETVEEPVEEEDAKEKEEETDDEAAVEEEEEDKKPKTKKVGFVSLGVL